MSESSTDAHQDDLDLVDPGVEIDLDYEVKAETEAEDDEAEELLPKWAAEGVVEMYGRAFTITEPSIGITLRIIRVLGLLGVRGEKTAMRALRSLAEGSRLKLEASWRAAVFGMLAALQEEDLQALGSAVFQFEDDREGRRFMANPPPGERLRLSPIIRAFWLNVAKSEDLQDALNDFFVGMGMTSSILEGLKIGP